MSTGEKYGAVTRDHDEPLVIFAIVVVGDLAAMFEPHREGVDEREGWVGNRPSLVDR